MSVKLRKKKTKKGESLYLDIYHNGKREYEFLKIQITKDKESNKEKMRIAESIRAKRELEILGGAHGLTPNFKKKTNFVEYFEKITREKKSDHNYSGTLKHLKEFTGGAVKFLNINENWIEQFKAHLLSKLTNNSACVYFTVLKTVLKKAVKEKIIQENPAQHIDTIKTTDVERVYLTHEELNKLFCSKCPDEVKRAFLFACYTGLRFSDLKRLTWEKVQSENGRFKLQYRQKKTGGFEYFPLSETANKLLKSNGGSLPDKPVFRLSSIEYYNVVLKDWAKNAGIAKKISSHIARHTFATLALSNGVDLYTVSKLLGHRNIATTQIYAKIVDKKKEEAVDMLPALELSSL